MKSAVVFCLCSTLLAPAQVRYNIVALLPTDRSIADGAGLGLNSHGDAAGEFYDVNYSTLRAFRYSDQGGFVDLGTSPLGTSLRVSGINDLGQVAGYGNVTGAAATHPFRYSPGGGFVDLGTFGGRENETAGINNRGQVVGFSSTTDGREHAFLYTDGVGMRDLGTLPGAVHSAARGINELGWVTGTSGNRAFVHTDEGGMVDIGPGSGWAINDAGVVVGEASGYAAMYLGGEVYPLWAPGSARGINNHNEVVGYGEIDSSQVAVIWSEKGGAEVLNSLIDPNSGWYLASASDINDDGQIVGWGTFAGRPGLLTPFRLDPIPEPSTWALMLLGTGALVWVRSRKGG